MKIATAQIKVKVGDLKGNLKKHIELIDIAIKNNTDLIVFPEMSLTGYCREEGKRLAMNELSAEIVELKNIAALNNLVIVIGAPILIDEKLYIGSYILIPNSDIAIYTKQFLHAGEEAYYSNSFNYNPKLKLKGETILFAICADIDNEEHPLSAKKDNCTLYLASIFFSQQGIVKGQKKISEYAKTYSMNILMSNYCGQVWGLNSAGKSGFWNKSGKLVAALNAVDEGLLILEKREQRWNFEKIIRK